MRSHGTHDRKPAARIALGPVVLIGGLICSIVPNGSVMPPYSHAGQMLMALSLLPVLVYPVWQRQIRQLVVVTLWGVTVLSVAIGVQGYPQTGQGFAHPVWADLSETLHVPFTYLSINPWRSLTALPSLVLPALVFVSALVLCQEDREARKMWVMLSGLGVCIVVLSIILETFFAELNFFSRYSVGEGAFSGVFVNRNVSAAFFAMTAFALVGTLALLRAGKSNASRAPMSQGQNEMVHLILVGIAIFICVIAIIVTRSRAGTLISLPLLSLCLVFIFDGWRRGERPTRKVFIAASLAIGLVVLLLAVFGEPVLSRIESDSMEGRACANAATWEAIRDNPVWGTGFATFRDIFPAYRDGACLGTRGVWLRAHNSFLEFYLGLGLAAGITMIVACLVIARTLLRGFAERRSLRALPIVTAALVVYIGLHSTVDFPLQIPGLAHYFAALLGCGLALCVAKQRHRRRRRARERRSHEVVQPGERSLEQRESRP